MWTRSERLGGHLPAMHLLTRMGLAGHCLFDSKLARCNGAQCQRTRDTDS